MVAPVGGRLSFSRLRIVATGSHPAYLAWSISLTTSQSACSQLVQSSTMDLLIREKSSIFYQCWDELGCSLELSRRVWIGYGVCKQLGMDQAYGWRMDHTTKRSHHWPLVSGAGWILYCTARTQIAFWQKFNFDFLKSNNHVYSGYFWSFPYYCKFTVENITFSDRWVLWIK